MNRPLLLDNIARSAVAEVIAFAYANWYRPGKSETVPGKDPRHVALVPFGFRCVFSFTYSESEKRLFRHLTVSVPGKKYPNPMALYSIAELFGFTGWNQKSIKPPDQWQCTANAAERCVVILQEVDPESMASK